MSPLFSENRYIDISVQILLFLMGINFLHYGQLILPLICFLLFIDHRFVFKVNSPLTFAVLCLFAVSFYYFSNKDFYCVMGFTLPMAYYIGCNMKNPDSQKIFFVVYLLAFAMGLHVILNSVYEFIRHGSHGFFFSSTHYDFWTKEKISNTATAINADLLIGCLYFLVFHEKNKKIRIFLLGNLLLSMFYLMVIGRRTPVLMLGISFVLSFLYDSFILKNTSAKLRKAFVSAALCLLGLLGVIILVFSLNLFGLSEKMMGFQLVRKFSSGLFNDERFRLYFSSFALMPKYLWGGQQISAELGQQIHDFWIDIYDYAGIVSFGLMLVYSLFYLRDMIRFFRSGIDSKLRLLMVGVLSCVVMQMFLEPVMSGASLFAITAVLLHGLFEGVCIHERP